jgi:hypothetical protein
MVRGIFIAIALVAFVLYAVKRDWQTCVWIFNSILWASVAK